VLTGRGDPVRVVRCRFDLLTDALGLDRGRAVGRAAGRLLPNALWGIEDGAAVLDPCAVALARALRD
jgi:streptomycin 6-kinase